MSRTGQDVSGIRAEGRPVALVVEDDPDAAEIARQMLAMLGWEVVVAANGEQALFSLSTCPPDLVLLDICLPDLDGLGVLRVARRLTTTRDVAVVAASAIHRPESSHGEVLRELGVTDLLAKPFGMEQLRTAVDAAITSSNLRSEWRRKVGAASPPNADELQPRARALLVNGAVEVVLGRWNERDLAVRSWSEPLAVGDVLEIVVEADSGVRVRAAVHVERVEQETIGWVSYARVRAAAPAEAFEALLRRL